MLYGKEHIAKVATSLRTAHGEGALTRATVVGPRRHRWLGATCCRRGFDVAPRSRRITETRANLLRVERVGVRHGWNFP